MAYIPPFAGGHFNATLAGNSTSAGAGYAQVSTGTLTIAGGNNITLSQNGNAVTVSAFNQSVQTQNLLDVTLAGNSTSAGAGYALMSSGTLTLAGGNNVTLSQNGNAVTISAAAGGGGAGSNTLGMSNLGNASGTTGVISGSALQYAFAGGNNVTLSQSLNASSGTITISAASQTNQSVGLYASGNTVGQSSSTTVDARSLSFNASGNASIGYSNGSVLISNAGISNINLSAGTTSANLSNAVFSNSNNVSFGLSGSTITGTASFSQTNQTLGKYVFGNTTGQSSSTTVDARSISYTAAGGASLGFSAGSLIVSAPPAQTVQTQNLVDVTMAGNTAGAAALVSSGTLSLAGGNQITLSQAGNAITISGNAATISTFVNMLPGSTSSTNLGAGMGTTSASAFFSPVSVESYLAFDALRIAQYNTIVTTIGSANQTAKQTYGLYSNNASTLSLISSASMSFAASISSVSMTLSQATATGTAGYTYGTKSASGSAQANTFWGKARAIDIQFGNTMSLSPGMYYLGILDIESSSLASAGISFGIAGNMINIINTIGWMGSFTSQATTDLNIHAPYLGFGSYTNSTNALPSTVALTAIAQSGSVLPFMTFIST